MSCNKSKKRYAGHRHHQGHHQNVSGFCSSLLKRILSVFSNIGNNVRMRMTQPSSVIGHPGVQPAWPLPAIFYTLSNSSKVERSLSFDICCFKLAVVAKLLHPRKGNLQGFLHRGQIGLLACRTLCTLWKNQRPVARDKYH